MAVSQNIATLILCSNGNQSKYGNSVLYIHSSQLKFGSFNNYYIHSSPLKFGNLPIYASLFK